MRWYSKVIDWLTVHYDWVLHFTVCLILMLFITCISNWEVGLFLTFAAAAFKEFFDSFRPDDHIDFKDVAADVLGMLLAIFFLWRLGCLV